MLTQSRSSSWAEGTGLDMDEYADLGKSNWMSASTTAAWTSIGGDFRDDNEDSDAPVYRQTFALGYEDLEINITPTVERWMQTSGTALHIDNYGLGIFLTSSQEAYTAAAAANGVIENTGGAGTSYYTRGLGLRLAGILEFKTTGPLSTIAARWPPLPTTSTPFISTTTFVANLRTFRILERVSFMFHSSRVMPATLSPPGSKLSLVPASVMLCVLRAAGLVQAFILLRFV